MRKGTSNSRRAFIEKVSKGVAAATIIPTIARAGEQDQTTEWLKRGYSSPNDQVQIALIGAGGMGNGDAQTAISVPGVKLVAACDLYDGHLAAAKKSYGNDIFVTKDYKEVLSRKDIDAVIIATPDHWHKEISVDAMNQGKAVYCEKPMVHDITEGPAVVAAQAKNKVVFQVGSQGMSSLGNEKAKELYEAGAIGQLNYAEGFWARNTPGGAWQYNMPEDGSDKTVDWTRFLHGKPNRPFDPKRFFRWRCFKDYGTGVSGDLFVHLFSSLHYIVSSPGPNRIMSTGGLRYWKDGREVPDILLGMFDYPQTPTHPAFNLSLRVNFVDGTGSENSLRLVGNEGSMLVEWDKVTLIKNKFWPPEHYAKYFSEHQYEKDYDRKSMTAPDTTVFKADNGYKGAHYDHFYNWIRAIRGGKPVMEDAVFGYRAAAPALLCNDSYYQEKAIKWDPLQMKLI